MDYPTDEDRAYLDALLADYAQRDPHDAPTYETPAHLRPQFVDGSAGPDRGAAAPAFGPQLLADGWDSEDAEIVPTMGMVDGAEPLLYPEAVVAVVGRYSSGKSWVSYRWAIEQARAGRVALIIDYENSLRAVRAKLRTLGATREDAARLAYWGQPGSLLAGTRGGAAYRQWLVEFTPSLVVIDSVAKSAASCGLNDSRPEEYIQWETQVAVPAKQVGACCLLIDHVGHQQEGSDAGKRARGASSKPDQADVQYLITMVEQLSKEQPGRATIKVLKDRHGARAIGDVAAEVAFTPVDGGATLRVVVSAAVPAVKAADGGFRPTGVMERVSRYLEGAGGPATQSQVLTAVGGNERTVLRALEVLVAEGFVAPSSGARGSKLSTAVRPYRDEERVRRPVTDPASWN